MSPSAACVRVASSLGRRYPEPSHPYRSDFQRDRDRVIHCRAFRRLENKTQVFTTRFSDHFRNRLTHTIEVAQIARTVAQALGLNADLAEALALAHDIGHPPFGHTGEASLNQAMSRYGDRFEHNLHALRIVEHFEQRYPAFPGLNLTFEVREGILKHSRDYPPEEAPQCAEFLLDQKPPLEAQLIDLVDEIAYNTADLDDGYEARLLEIDAVMADSPLFAGLFRKAESAFPDASLKMKFNETIRRLLDTLATDLIAHTAAAVASSGAASVADVRRQPARLAGLSPEMAAETRGLKQFLLHALYQHPSLMPEREAGGQMVAELFEVYMAEPTRLPPSYQEQAQSEPLHRVVCDYLAGMTDSYLEKIYRAETAGKPPRHRDTK
jgi:dGTPase